MSAEAALEVATLAGGCFWCMEAVFREVEGVRKVVSGYSGGVVPSPSYEQVSSGNTGHAETVQVTFDRTVISLRDILEIFFSVHDPTTINRQGPDIGTQYRSVIFYSDKEQETVARKLIGELTSAGRWKQPIVTQLVPLDKFYPAEEYHQGYFSLHPEQSYSQAVISPKVSKFRHIWAKRLKKPAA